MKLKFALLIILPFFFGCDIVQKEINNSLDMKFVFVEPGSFIMGFRLIY